jgi:hypothetical protein
VSSELAANLHMRRCGRTVTVDWRARLRMTNCSLDKLEEERQMGDRHERERGASSLNGSIRRLSRGLCGNHSLIKDRER